MRNTLAIRKWIVTSCTIILILFSGLTALFIFDEFAGNHGFSSSAKTIIVDDDGTPGVDCNYTKIQYAIDNASIGDTVFVKNGTYNETLRVSKTISLTGEDRNSTILEIYGDGPGIYINADWVNLSGFSLHYIGGSSISSSWGGIVVLGVENCTLTNLNVSNHVQSGIVFLKVNNSLISENILNSNFNAGIQFSGSRNNIIINNTCNFNTGHDTSGIELLYQSNDNYVANNKINANSFGIWVGYGTKGNRLENNTITQNNRGINIYYGSNNNTIINNMVIFNQIGIYVINSPYNLLINNNISYNWKEGIALVNARFSKLYNNTMLEDSIYVRGDALVYWNTHKIPINNTVNGKPVRYWTNKTGGTVPYDNTGEVILANCTNVVVENQTLNLNTAGIVLGFSNFNTLNNNSCSFSSIDGILIAEWSNNNTIQNNNLFRTRNGIYFFRNSDNNTFVNNTSDNELSWDHFGGSMIFIDDSNDQIILNNTGNGSHAKSIRLKESDGNIFRGNLFSNNIGSIDLIDSNNNLIDDNTILPNNIAAFSFSKSHNNIIVNNTLLNKKEGLNMTDSTYNLIYNNYFDTTGISYDLENSPNNTFNISKTPGTNIIGGPYLGGNYWSDYLGEDIDSDTIGDTLVPYGPGDALPLTLNLESVSPSITDKTTGNPTTGEPFTLKAGVSDPGGNIESAFVRYWVDLLPTSNVTMDLLSGNSFSADYNKTISIPDYSFKLYYAFSATDLNNNWKSTLVKSLDILDNDRPVIGDHTGSNPTTGEDFVIEFSTTDNIEVESAYLEYWFDDDIAHQNLTVSSAGISYSKIITVSLNAKILNYRLSAVDSSSNWAVPVTGSLNIVDNDRPDIVDLSDIPTTGDEFTFIFNITDNIEISTAYLEFWFDEGAHTNITLPGDWRHTATVPPDAFDLHFFVSVIDASNNWKQLIVDKAVIDNDAPIISDLTTGNPETGGAFTFKCTVDENRLMDEVIFKHRFDGDEFSSDIVALESGLYSLEVAVPIDALVFDCMMTAEDAAGNSDEVNNSLAVLDIIPPEIFDLTVDIPTTGDDFKLKANAQDNILVDSFYMDYWFDEGGHTNVSFDVNLTLTAPSDALMFYYLFTATDSSGNIGSYSTDIDVIDNDPPEITDQLPEPRTGETCSFSYEVSDNIAVAFSSFECWFDDDVHEKISNVSELWIWIPLHATVLNYIIYAEDTSENNAQLTRTLNVTDIINPMHNDSSLKSDDGFKFEVKASDNIAVVEVIVEYRFGDGDIKNITLVPEDEMYGATIAVPEGAETLTYTITVTDGAGNLNRSDAIAVDVAEPDTGPDPDGTGSKKKGGADKSSGATILILIIIIILMVIAMFYVFVYRKRTKIEEPAEEEDGVEDNTELDTPEVEDNNGKTP